MAQNTRLNITMVDRRMRELNPLLVGSERCVPGHSFGPAVRKYTLIHYVVEGTGRVFKGDRVYTVHAGEAFLIHPGEVVTYTADAHDPWFYQWVGFDGTLSEHLRQLPDVIPFPSGLIREMLDEVDKDLAEYRIAAVLYRMYVALLEGKRTGHHYVRRVQSYIHTLYMHPIRVEEIADELSLNRRYLSRLFKEKTGQTMQEYLIGVRMEEAVRYLSEGFSVSEAATLCGYESVGNFSRMFKKRFGISPQQWRVKR